MTLLDLKYIAQERGFDSLEFYLIGPNSGRLKCRFSDAYLGLFEVIDPHASGCLNVKDFVSPEIKIELIEKQINVSST